MPEVSQGPLATLPAEIIVHIANHLAGNHWDAAALNRLTRLSGVCRRFRDIIGSSGIMHNVTQNVQRIRWEAEREMDRRYRLRPQ